MLVIANRKDFSSVVYWCSKAISRRICCTGLSKNLVRFHLVNRKVEKVNGKVRNDCVNVIYRKLVSRLSYTRRNDWFLVVMKPLKRKRLVLLQTNIRQLLVKIETSWWSRLSEKEELSRCLKAVIVACWRRKPAKWTRISSCPLHESVEGCCKLCKFNTRT